MENIEAQAYLKLAVDSINKEIMPEFLYGSPNNLLKIVDNIFQQLLNEASIMPLAIKKLGKDEVTVFMKKNLEVFNLLLFQQTEIIQTNTIVNELKKLYTAIISDEKQLQLLDKQLCINILKLISADIRIHDRLTAHERMILNGACFEALNIEEQKAMADALEYMQGIQNVDKQKSEKFKSSDMYFIVSKKYKKTFHTMQCDNDSYFSLLKTMLPEPMLDALYNHKDSSSNLLTKRNKLGNLLNDYQDEIRYKKDIVFYIYKYAMTKYAGFTATEIHHLLAEYLSESEDNIAKRLSAVEKRFYPDK